MSPGWLKQCIVLLLVFAAAESIFAGQAVHAVTNRPGIVPASEYSWQRWTREHGLPDNTVQCLLQSDDGYLWVGTRAGLGRFDGLKWTVFNRANTAALVSDNCHALAQDIEGTLWIGTDHGLVSFKEGQFHRYDPDYGPEGGEPGVLCPSRRGGLWFGAGNTLNRFLAGKFTRFTRADGLAAAVGALFEDEQGVLWVGTAHGVQLLDPDRGQLSTNLIQHSRAKTVHVLRKDRSENLWASFMELNRTGADVLVNQWVGRWAGAGQWESFAVNPLSNGGRPFFMIVDAAGALWMPTDQGGLLRHRDGANAIYSTPGFENDFLQCGLCDREGNLWFGAEKGGLHRLRRKSVQVFSAAEGLPHNQAWTVCNARDGSVWIGTDGGASQWKDGRFTHWSEQNGLSRNTVRSIVEDQDGRIWIGTGAGLNWIEDGRLRQRFFPGDWSNTKIRALFAGRGRKIWLGTVNGLCRLDLTTKSARVSGQRPSADDDCPPFSQVNRYGVTNGLAHEDVRALLEDSSNHLWIGTAGGGLHRFRDGRFEVFTSRDGLGSEFIWAVHKDAQGSLWVGTDRGLTRHDQGRFVTLDTRHGLPENSINQILEDDFDNLWLGGERGIYRIRKEALHAVADGRASVLPCVCYDEDDGLPISETNGQKSYPAACKTGDGQLWFPTPKGVVVFDPRHLPDNTNPPPVVVEQVRAQGEIIFDTGPAELARARVDSSSDNQKRDVRLRAGSGRTLDIVYTANSFVTGSKLRFKYRLEGLDDDWIDAGRRRSAHYANLKPGRYRFHVRAVNKHGIWSESGASFGFTLAPFFWQTWWFKSGCVLALITGAGLWWVRQHRAAQAAHAAAVATERAEIARDLHDQLGPRLTLARHLVHALEKGPGENGEPTQQKLARLVQEIHASVDSAVWAVKPEKDTLASLTDYLGDRFHDLLAGAGIELELDFPDHVPVWPLSRTERYHLALVAAEALNNAMKHSRASLLQLRLQLAVNAFTLDITDNGCGFDSGRSRSSRERSSGGHGLENMRWRMEQMSGQLNLVSQPGRGTTVSLTLERKGIQPEAGQAIQRPQGS